MLVFTIEGPSLGLPYLFLFDSTPVFITCSIDTCCTAIANTRKITFSPVVFLFSEFWWPAKWWAPSSVARAARYAKSHSKPELGTVSFDFFFHSFTILLQYRLEFLDVVLYFSTLAQHNSKYNDPVQLGSFIQLTKDHHLKIRVSHVP